MQAMGLLRASIPMVTTASEPALDLTLHSDGSGDICSSILGQLPQWFGIPSANADYAAAADRHPTVIAMTNGQPVGVLTTVQHSDAAAEVYVMAVLPEYHRRGIGAAMLTVAEQDLSQRGITFLQVKTLAATHPDAGYVKTRAFYQANGFEVLEVFPDLWGSDNPALQMVKHIGNGPRAQ